MNIETAIKQLEGYLEVSYMEQHTYLYDAIRLGKEALERIKYLHGAALYPTDAILPSETRK